ncbi:MAG: ATP-binding protein, partial [Clostridia bacterium]|nr:ATP-binding protein [Clostridia bacterium]
EILNTVFTELSPDAEANGIVMEISAKHSVAFAKPDALKSVLQNLVLNAIEHADCSKIWLRAHRRLDKCVITVSDNGKGFGDKDVFRPYYSGNEGEENIGLGLYICKSHIEAMNGSLTYEYSDHKLIFTIILPIA